MFFGLEISGIVKFLMQASAATAGAISLWSFIFLLKEQKGLVRLLAPLFWSAIIVFLLTWVLSTTSIYSNWAQAHEGLRLVPSDELISQSLRALSPLVILAGLLTIWGFYFKKQTTGYFLAQFVIWSTILAASINTGSFSREQIFFALHSWHSILTLGTVITVDFLFVATQYKDDLKRFLYPFFPYLSAAIWTGLGIDFAANMLIFDKVFIVTEQFLFTQAVVVIIIINGALLSGKINGWMIDLIKPDKVLEFTPKMKKIAEISGALSITSWVTITLIDGFTLTASLYQLLAVYILAILAVYFLKPLAERGIKKLASYAV